MASARGHSAALVITSDGQMREIRQQVDTLTQLNYDLTVAREDEQARIAAEL